MAMTIRLQDEGGGNIDEVHDTKGLIVDRLPPLSDLSYHCLRFIDPYGDTYFNEMQIDTLLAEWDRIFGNVQDNETRDLADRIRRLALSCKKEPHLYIKFVGD
jgi:hypothetical protein